MRWGEEGLGEVGQFCGCSNVVGVFGDSLASCWQRDAEKLPQDRKILTVQADFL